MDERRTCRNGENKQMNQGPAENKSLIQIKVEDDTIPKIIDTASSVSLWPNNNYQRNAS